MLPLHALLFKIRINVMDPGFILGHNSVHKLIRVILMMRQEIPRNIEEASLLIFSQLSGDPSSLDIGHS